MVVFLISGLWHGANWTFVIWGALNGFYLIIGLLTQTTRTKFCNTIGLVKLPKLYLFLQIISTFILASFAWIFFRANKISDAIYIIKKILRRKSN